MLAQAYPDKVVTVLNLGVSAQDSRSHVSTLAHHAVNLDLDYVLILLGANDMYRSGVGFAPHLSTLYLSVEIAPSWRDWLFTRSQTGRRLYEFRQQTSAVYRAQTEAPKNAPYFYNAASFRRQLPELSSSVVPSAALMAEYRRNILSMDGIARSNGIHAIFVTQPALWSHENSAAELNVMWMATYLAGNKWYKLPSSTAFDMLAAMNTSLMQVCSSAALSCIDLAASIPRNLDAFYDDMHFNEHGARLVARALADKTQRLVK